MIQEDADREILILRQKLTETEDRLAAVNGAVVEAEFRMYQSMKKLLAANDVNADPAMRVNIHEIMNDMARDVIDFFYNKRLIPCGSREMWPPFKKGQNASHGNGSGV